MCLQREHPAQQKNKQTNKPALQNQVIAPLLKEQQGPFALAKPPKLSPPPGRNSSVDFLLLYYDQALVKGLETLDFQRGLVIVDAG